MTNIQENDDVSVIIVSYKTGNILWKSIDSVLKQNSLKELVIVDNGNDDNVLERLLGLSSVDSRVKVLSGHGNIGFSTACNLGADNATGEYLLFLNPDSIIPENSLAICKKELNKDPSYFMAGAKLINPNGSEQAGSRRNILTPIIALTEGIKLHKILSGVKRLNAYKQLHGTTIVPAISGAFMFISTTKFNEIEGFDDKYFLHVEDLDLCLKVNRSGGKVIHIPSVNVIHYRSTSDVSCDFVEWQKVKSFIRYFCKNYNHAYLYPFFLLLFPAIYTRFALRSVHNIIRKINPINWLKKKAKNGIYGSNEHRKRLLQLSDIYIKNGHSFNGDDIELLGKNSNVIVAGSTGQVGCSIVRRLLAAKIDTIALFNSSIVDTEHKNLTWKFANLYGEKTLDLTGIGADTLVYTPALWHLPHNIEEFAKTGVKRIICFSSTSIEGKAKSNNQDEKELVQRFTKSEQDVKEICSSLGIQFTIIRPTLIYGVGLDKNITNIVKFIRCFNRFPVFSNGSGKRKPVHVDDLAKSVLSVMFNKKTYGKIYNLCGNEVLTYHEMVGRIFDSMGLRRKIINFNSLPRFMDLYGKLLNNKNVNAEIALRMQEDLIFADEEAREDFGYNPRAFLKSGLHDIYPDFKRTLQDYSKFSEKIIKEQEEAA